MNKKIANLDLSPVNARQIVSEIAKDSSKVYLTDHAEERAVERKITRTQIIRCLRFGRIIENPYRDLNHDWVMTFETISAGDPITVVASIRRNQKGEMILVITTY